MSEATLYQEKKSMVASPFANRKDINDMATSQVLHTVLLLTSHTKCTIEKMHKRATQMMTGLWHLPYEDRLLCLCQQFNFCMCDETKVAWQWAPEGITFCPIHPPHQFTVVCESCSSCCRNLGLYGPLEAVQKHAATSTSGLAFTMAGKCLPWLEHSFWWQTAMIGLGH